MCCKYVLYKVEISRYYKSYTKIRSRYKIINIISIGRSRPYSTPPLRPKLLRAIVVRETNYAS